MLLLFTLGWSASAGWAQSGSPSASPSASVTRMGAADLRLRLEEVDAALKAAPTPPVSSEIEQAGQAPPYYTSLLRMEISLRRLVSLTETEALLVSQIQRVDTETLDFTQNGLGENPPYPVTLLDDLQSRLSLASEAVESQEAGLVSAKTDAKLQNAQLEDRQALRRRLIDQGAKPAASNLELDRALENAVWAVKAAEIAKELADAEIGVAEHSRTLARKRQELLARKVELVKSSFQFTKAILEAQLDRIDANRGALNASLVEVVAKSDQALAKLKALEQSASADPVKAAQREAEAEWLTTYQRRKLLLEQSLELNLLKRDLWERRYGLSRGQALNSLTEWEESTRSLMRRLESGRKSLDSQLGQLRGHMAAVVESTPDGDIPVEDWRNNQAKAIAAHQSSIETALTDYSETLTLAQRLLSEIQGQRKGLSWRERVARGWGVLVSFWHIELYTIGDSSVTVGKINIAFLVLIFGLTLVGRSTRFVSRRLLTHLPLADSVRGNIERWVRYFLILMVCLTTLRVVNIPLTIFTFLGGTLAIAVGFGAQNILNNFISGLILMVERPVRVGDLIEVDKTAGVVEDIGARSTRMRMATGIHVVLPNSVLLENRVVNWTLTDQMVRTSVTVGAAYGSDPREVMALISRAAFSLDTLEKTPEPFVVLDDFADSSIKFTIHFWVSMADPLNKRMTESNLRIAIDGLFRENGISMPFPQRDLNLSGPLSVKLESSAAFTQDQNLEENPSV